MRLTLIPASPVRSASRRPASTRCSRVAAARSLRELTGPPPAGRLAPGSVAGMLILRFSSGDVKNEQRPGQGAEQGETADSGGVPAGGVGQADKVEAGDGEGRGREELDRRENTGGEPGRQAGEPGEVRHGPTRPQVDEREHELGGQQQRQDHEGHGHDDLSISAVVSVTPLLADSMKGQALSRKPSGSEANATCPVSSARNPAPGMAARVSRPAVSGKIMSRAPHTSSTGAASRAPSPRRLNPGAPKLRHSPAATRAPSAVRARV